MPFLSSLYPKIMPKTPKLSHLLHPKPFSSTSKPPVAVFWDLKSKPPDSISLYDAAFRLRLAAASFGPLRFIAAFAESRHVSAYKTLILPPKSHPCRVCGRNFFDRSKLLHHFDQIHRCEQIKRLNRINSARGAQRRQLSAKLAMKIENFNKVAKEIVVPREGYGLVDDLKRARVLVIKVDDFAGSIRARMLQEIERGGIGCLVLVSDDSRLVEVVKESRMRLLMSVVIGDEGRWDLKRNADVGYSWKDVVSGKVRSHAESALRKWKDKDLVKRLEWRYDEIENVEEDEWDGFDVKGEDGGLNLAAEKGSEPWWMLDLDSKS